MHKAKPVKKVIRTIKQLSQVTGLDWDHCGERRLFAETIFIESLKMNVKEYIDMENKLNSFEIKGKGFVVYMWNDSSGYKYWNVMQEENNYVQITVKITKVTEVDVNKIMDAVQKARDFVSQWQ